MEKVAIILPVHNASKFIKDALNDILNQTYENWNCYIIDDGSTDDTKLQISEYLKDARFKYFYQENAGPGMARNKGLDEMGEEDYIYMPDADDRMDSRLIEDCVNCLREIPAVDVVRFQHYEMASNGKIIFKIYNTSVPRIADGFEEGHFFPHIWGCWGYIVRSKIIKEHHIRFNTTLKNFEDFLFSMDLLYINPRVLLIPDVYYIWYHRNTTSLTARHYLNGIFTVSRRCCEIGIIPWLKAHDDFIFKKYLLKFIDRQFGYEDIKASGLNYFAQN